MPKRTRPESPAAALARLRWAGTTPEERADHARMMVQAREAGRARARAAEEGREFVKSYRPTPEEEERIAAFFRGMGPYQSDVWSNSYPFEILEEIRRRGENRPPEVPVDPEEP